MNEQPKSESPSPGEDSSRIAARDASGNAQDLPIPPPAESPMPISVAERLKTEIEKRLGFFPPYFTPALKTPDVLESLWMQTLTGNLDNPIPLLLKEKLLARLARYCSVAYPIVTHSANLWELGMTAGEVLEVLELPIPAAEADLEHHLKTLEGEPVPLVSWPEHNSVAENSLVHCALFFFAHPGRSGRCHQVISHLLSPEQYARLMAFFAYVRSYHLWVETYPGPPIETIPRVWDEFVSMLRQEPRLAKVFRDYREKTVERRGQPGVETLQKAHAELEAKFAKNSADLARAIEILKEEIGRRKRIESELSCIREQYKELFENTVDLVFTHDSSGKLSSFNSAAERLTGYSRDEALQLTLAQLIAPEYADVLNQMLNPGASTETPARCELVFITRNGQRLALEAAQRSILTPRGPEFQTVGRIVTGGTPESHDLQGAGRDADAAGAGIDSAKDLLSDSAELLAANEALQARLAERAQAEEALRNTVAELSSLNEALRTRMAEQESLVQSLQEPAAEPEDLHPTPTGETSDTAALQSQLAERERDIEALRKVLAESETRSAVLLTNSDSLQTRAGELERAAQASHQALVDSEARQAELQKTNEALESRADDLEQTVQTLRQALADTEARLNGLIRAHEALQAQKSEQEALRNAVADTEAHLQRDADELREANEGLRSESSEQARTIEALRLALSESEARFEELSRIHEASQAQIDEQQRAMQDLRKTLADSEARAAELVKDSEATQAQIGEQERTLQDLHSALAGSEARATELMKAHKDSQVQTADLERALHDLHNALAGSEARAMELAQAREASQAQIAEQERTLQDLRSALVGSEARATELAQAREASQAQITQLERTLQELREALADSETRATELTRAHEASQTLMAEREITLQDLRRALADSEAGAAELAKAHESSQAQIAGQERTLQDLRRALADSEAREAESARVYEASQTQSREQERLVEALRQALADSEARATELARTHESCRSQIDERQRTVEALRLALADSENRAAELARAQEASQVQIDQHQQTVEVLRKAADELESRIQGEMVELSQANEMLRVQLDEHRGIEESMRKALSDAETLSVELKRVNEALQSRMVAQEESEKSLRKAHEELAASRGVVDEYGRRLGLLSEMGSMLLACLNTNEAITVIPQLVDQIFPDQAGGIYLLKQGQNLVEAAVEWGNPASSTPSFETEACVALRRNRVHAVKNVGSGLICKHVKTTVSGGYLCVPMMAKGEVLGVFHLRQGKTGPASDAEQRLAVTVSEYIAMSLSYLTRQQAQQP